MEIEKVVQEEFAKIVESGKIREMIATSLAKSIQSSIDDALRSYGDFGKALATKVKEAVGVELGNVNLQTAAIGLGKLVEAQVSRYVTEQTHPMLLKQLDDLFQPAPKTIALQSLIDAYKDDEADSARDDGIEYCGLVISATTTDGIEIGLNPSHEKSKSGYSGGKEKIREVRNCELKLHLKKCEGGYQIWWLKVDDYTSVSSKTFLPTALYGMARKVFQMYAAGTVLTLDGVDADDYDTSYPGND